MSGGTFDHKQYVIREIADNIEQVLRNQGKLKHKDELWLGEEHYKKYLEEKYYTTYPKEVQEQMREGLRILRVAAVYAHRIDYYLAADDGDESFLERLKEDLDGLKTNI